MSGPWRMLRTAPEPNGTEQRALKSGRRKRQKRMPMPESRRQLQKKQRRCGGSPKKEGPPHLFVCGQKHRIGRAASRAAGIGERGVLSSGGKGVPAGNGNPLPGMILVKRKTGSVKSSAQGTLSQTPLRPKSPGRSHRNRRSRKKERRNVMRPALCPWP